MNDYLENSEWQKPYDESPIEPPDAWEGGAVEHTGGNILCRIWRHKEKNQDIAYNLDNCHVSLNQYDNDGYHVEEIDTVEADSSEDSDLANAAAVLMQYQD